MTMWRQHIYGYMTAPDANNLMPTRDVMPPHVKLINMYMHMF